MRGKARTTKEKKELYRSLEPYFRLGYSVNKACNKAGIPQSTVDDLLKDNELRLKTTALQGLVSTEAREVLIERITKHRDPKIAQWWLERQEPDEFGVNKKVEDSGSSNNDYKTSKESEDKAERLAFEYEEKLREICIEEYT